MATTKKSDRCWPGYEPVPGKQQHEQGSCRKKAASKSTPAEKKVQAKRKAEIDSWKKSHPHTRRSAAQHLHSDVTASKTASGKKKRSAATSKTTKKRTAAPGKKRNTTKR